MSEFSLKDQEQIKTHGIPLAVVEHQLAQFQNGFPPIKLNRAAIIGDGIQQFSAEDAQNLVDTYEQAKSGIQVLKFVPASGAASRMFQPLYSFLDNEEMTSSIKDFKKHIADFAFYDELNKNCPNGSITEIISTLLNKMHFGELPKALIPFHSYKTGGRSAIDEHLVEGSMYANSNKNITLHFTVSAEHEEKIKKHLSALIGKMEHDYDVTFNLSFSVQSPATDTIAVNSDNTPFRNSDGSLLFRPGGHGALINNLNNLKAELVFVKNIDNVRPDHLKADTVYYKKVIAGYLLELKNKIHNTLASIEEGTEALENIEKMITQDLKLEFPIDYSTLGSAERKPLLMSMLNKPLRVCGMVKNEGEPGGGPFWVEDSIGQTSLQIVEKSQVDVTDETQNHILGNSTHFNPVDLVCWLYDYKGIKFDLNKYVDEDTGFITEKSKDGKTLKAMELPGLWNGAMANWLTFFVEVPSTTFSPVKTVLDLLRPEHQPPDQV